MTSGLWMWFPHRQGFAMATDFLHELVYPKAPGSVLSVFILYPHHLRAHLASWLYYYPNVSSLPELHFSVFCYLWSTSSEAQVGCPPYFRCLNYPSTQLPPPSKTTFLSQLLFINDAFEKGDYPPTKESPATRSSPECSSAVHSKRIESSGFSKGPKTKYLFFIPYSFFAAWVCFLCYSHNHFGLFYFLLQTWWNPSVQEPYCCFLGAPQNIK